MTEAPIGRPAPTLLLEQLAVPVMLVSVDGDLVYANPAARAVSGLKRGPLGRDVRVAVPPDTLHWLRESGSAGSKPTRLVVNANNRAITIEARLSWAAGYHAPGYDSDADEPLLLVEGVIESAANRKIQRLTEQLVAISFGYPDMRFEIGRDGAILDFVVANPSQINLTPENLVERNLQKALPHPAGELLAAAVERTFANSGARGSDESLSFSLPGAEGIQHFEARLVELADGDRILISVRNVTDRVNAEREAAQTRDRLMEALESISQGFVLYDSEDRLVLANSRYREMFDASPESIKPGVRFEDVLRDPDVRSVFGVEPGELEDWVQSRLAFHRVGGSPVEAQLSGGRWMRIEERTTRSGDRVGLRSDITELKQREADLQAAREVAERANQQKTGFVHHLSHELRTPLNAVLGFAQMIADQLLGPVGNPRYAAYAGQIAEAGSYMLELINNLLDLAKIDAGRFPLTEDICELPVLTELTLSMVDVRASRVGVTLVDSIPRDLPPLLGDCSLIRQMLTNLIANAIKFCPPNGSGQVEVGAFLNDRSELALFVKDNGAGMSPEQLPRALSPFEQAHDRTRTPELGTGLGLPLTRALIELHGGRFEITSAVGVGTTVYLIFPPTRVMNPTDGEGS